jgi:threonine aldolase
MAEILSEMDEMNVDQTLVQTNMVFVGLRKAEPAKLKDYLCEKGVLINTGDPIRMVTHRDVSQQDIADAVDKIKMYFNKKV